MSLNSDSTIVTTPFLFRDTLLRLLTRDNIKYKVLTKEKVA